jgi:hypothetical protein
MAASRVLVTAQTLPGTYPSLPPGAGSLALGFQAADPSLKNYTLLVPGKTVLLAMNTDSSAHTVTVSSVVDEKNRKGDITAYSLAAITGTTPVVVPLGVFVTAGWLTPTDGTTPAGLWFEASDATVKFAVLTLP